MKKYNKAVKDLIDKMFEISGYDIGYDNVVGSDEQWYLKYTMTEEQNNEWINWGINYLHKNRIFTSKKAAKKEMDWFNLSYGLKIK